MNPPRTITILVALFLLVGSFTLTGAPAITEIPFEMDDPFITEVPATQFAFGLAPNAVLAGDLALAESDQYFSDRDLFEEAFQYFKDVAFAAEYGDSEDRLKRWNQTISVMLEGDYTDDDYAALQQLISWLSWIDGMPPIEIVPEGGNHRFLFHPLTELETTVPDYPAGNWGLTYIWWDDDGHMTDGLATVATDVTDQIQRNHLIQEEFIQSLGLLYDSYDYADSIFQQEWTETQYPIAIDFAVIRMLYSPALRMSMNTDQAYKALLQYYGFN